MTLVDVQWAGVCNDFVKYFVQRGAKVMQEDPSGLRGGTVLTFDCMLR